VTQIISALAAWLKRRRAARALRVVDETALFGGAAVHVVDVGDRRIVFATSQRAICLLAQFEGASSGTWREEAAAQIADNTGSMCGGRAEAAADDRRTRETSD
jgi:hypothetical protein